MSSDTTPPVRAAAPSPASAAPAHRPRRRVARWLGGALALLIAAIAATIAALSWSLHHAAGSAWLLGFVPGLTIVEPSGSLLGDFSAARLVYTLAGAGELRLEAPRWHALAASRGDQGRWLRIAIDTLHADRAVWIGAKSAGPASPPALPSSLRLPVEIEIRAASVDELRVGAVDALPVRGVRARVHLGADNGGQHRFDDVAGAIERGTARGALAIGADAPFAVAATADVVAAANDWSATLRASGPLAALDVLATARVPARAGHAAQSLDAHAVVRPLAPWPLGALEASAAGLDLSAFTDLMPATALTGRASATTSGRDAPATVFLDVANARAGRWDEGLLPLRRLRAELRARPDDPSAIDVQSLSAELASGNVAAGNIVGRGRWTAAAWTIDADLREVRTAALDARAGDAVVSGKAKLVGSVAAAPAAKSRIDLSADLAGELADRRLPRAAPRSARLRVDASASADEIELRSATASLGDASASVTGRLVRAAASAPWRASGRLQMARFDPAPWWPGAADSPLGRGANRLNANGDFDLLLAPRREGESAYAAAAATTGTAQLAVVDSVLAGIEVRGQAAFANSDGRARPKLDLVAAGNRVQVDGTIAARGGGDDDWRIAIDAPRLDLLAPLLGSSPASDRAQRATPALAGSLQARAHVAGRWPQVVSDGELQATNVRLRTTSARGASGRWRLGSSDNAVVDGKLVLEGVDVAGRALDRAEAQVSGTARAHRLEMRVASALLPPAWSDALAAGATSAAGATISAGNASAAANRPVSTAPARSDPPGARSVFTAVAEGGLVDVDGHRAAGWRGTIREVDARSLATPARVWLSAREIRGSVAWAEGTLRMNAEPASAQVLGATVRWDRVAWQEGSARAPARLDAQATIDAIAVAPILQALQPGFGWGGDLRVGARLNVRGGADVTVDAVVERRAGDLTVTDEISTQPLGLSDLRLGIAAEAGVWHFTAAAAGASLGVVSAAVTARTSSAATWPGAQTPIEGVSELRVDNLGTWGAWLTPGWRLGGRLHASASFGGRFGAPQYTGHVEGTGVTVRNFLEGVHVSDGNVAIALRGTTAHIESFTARGGAGTLRLDGDAAFDEAPTAQLRLALERFELLGRVDRRIVASGNASMRLDAKTLGLDGTFKVDEGLIDFTRSDAPTLGSDVEVVRRPKASTPVAANASFAASASSATSASASSSQAQAPAPVARAVRLDLRVDMGEKLRVRGRGLDAGLRGELHLTSPAGRLAVNGTLRAVDGTYQAYGQKLGIDRGVLTFVGPVEDPRLDIEATRPNLDVRVGVTVTGSALYPRIRLFSDPDLSDIDKLSWLVLGRASATTGGADTALLQQAALALLSGEGPGVTDRLIKSIGLDEVSVRQQQGAVKDTIVSLGKQISKRWYVGYERGLNTTLGTWQLIYRVAQRITVRAEAGSDNAVDVIWTWRWK